jgi:hypothetical protein
VLELGKGLTVNNPVKDWQNDVTGLELGRLSSHHALAHCSRMCLH